MNTTPASLRKRVLTLISLIVVLVAVDQISKTAALDLLPRIGLAGALECEPGLGLGVVLNHGGPLGLDLFDEGNALAWRWLFPLCALSMLSILWISQLPKFPIAVMTAGGLSNLGEMMLSGSVVDFIVIKLPDRAHVANLADFMVLFAFVMLVGMAVTGGIRARHFGIKWFEKEATQ